MDEEAKTPDINQARPAASSGGVIGAAGVETQQRPQMPTTSRQTVWKIILPPASSCSLCRAAKL